jgi:signal transduction histidine kinase
VPVVVTVDGQYSLPPDVKVAFYRIAQEALNNVAKHSGATQAYVILRVAEDDDDDAEVSAEHQAFAIMLSVSDNGHGFDQAGVPSDHLGLGIMRERAETIGAELCILSQPGRGTEVTVTWHA